MHDVPFSSYTVYFKGGSFFLCSVYIGHIDLEFLVWEYDTENHTENRKDKRYE